MASVTYGKCNYGKCNYGKNIYGKNTMGNETEPRNGKISKKLERVQPYSSNANTPILKISRILSIIHKRFQFT